MAEVGQQYTINHDIRVENQIAFRAGERVLVEAIYQDLSMPDNQYVVYSQSTGKKFLLSDADLRKIETVAPSNYAVREGRERGLSRLLRPRHVVPAVILLLSLIAGVIVFFGTVSNYSVSVVDEYTKQPIQGAVSGATATGKSGRIVIHNLHSWDTITITKTDYLPKTSPVSGKSGKDKNQLTVYMRPSVLKLKVIDGVSGVPLQNVKVTVGKVSKQTDSSGTVVFANSRKNVHVKVEPGFEHEILEKDLTDVSSAELKICPDPSLFCRTIETALIFGQYEYAYSFVSPSDAAAVPYGLFVQKTEARKQLNAKNGWQPLEVRIGSVAMLPTWTNPNDGAHYNNVAEVQVTWVWKGPFLNQPENLVRHLVKGDDGIWRWFIIDRNKLLQY